MTEPVITHYTLEPCYAPDVSLGPQIMNASIGRCGTCGAVVTSMGGSNDMICLPCAEVILAGDAVGAIVWEK